MLEVLESPVQSPKSSFKINKPRQEATQTNTVTTSRKDTKTKKRKLRLTVCLLVQKMAAFGHFSSPRVYRLI